MCHQNGGSLLRTCMAALILCAGCDGASRVSGTVVDARGNACQRVMVELVSSTKDGVLREVREGQTDDDGRFSVGVMHPPTKVTLTLIVKSGGRELARISVDKKSSKALEIVSQCQ